jgi:hypothetical protein
MPLNFQDFIKEFAQSKGLDSDEQSIGLEFECEGHSVTLFQHPKHEHFLMADVSVAILSAHPPVEQLALLLQINEVARFEHDWAIVLDSAQQVSLTSSTDFSSMSVADLEALMLDGVERAQVLQSMLMQLQDIPMAKDTASAQSPGADGMMIRG